MDGLRLDGPDLTAAGISPQDGATAVQIEDDACNLYFSDFLNDARDLCASNGIYNDVVIVCAGGANFRVPSLLLATASPIFAGVASAFYENNGCDVSLILPDLNISDVEAFCKQCWVLGFQDFDVEVKGCAASRLQVSVSTVMDVLCGDWKPVEEMKNGQDENMGKGQSEVRKNYRGQPKKRRRARLAAPPPSQVWVSELARAETTYGLRRKIKRRRFLDEVSLPSAPENDDDDEFSSGGSEDYQPSLSHEEISDDNCDLEDAVVNACENLLMCAVYANPDGRARVLREKEVPPSRHEQPLKIPDKGRIIRYRDPEGKSIAVGKTVDVSCGRGDDREEQEKFTTYGKLLSASKGAARLVLFCSLCAEVFQKLQELRHHAAVHHPGSSKFFALPDGNPHLGCAKCSVVMKSYEKWIAARPDLRNFNDVCFPCPHCRRRYMGSVSGLANHLQVDHGDQVDHGLGGQSEDYFGVMEREADSERVLKCDFCSKSFRSTATLNGHLISCPENASGCSAVLHCEHCSKEFVHEKYLKLHVKRQHREQAGSHDDVDANGLLCSSCSYVGRSERHLRIHIRNKHRRKKPVVDDPDCRVPCPKCGKMRKEGPSIKSHVKKCGSGPEKVVCPQCQMEFKRTEDMQAHSLIHYGQLTCPIHNILFKNEEEVFHHVNIAPLEEKFPMLQCCMCERNFKHMCLFIKHLRQHLKIAPYRCKLCGKHLNTYASLQLHTQRVHNSVAAAREMPNKSASHDKKFPCGQCHKVFGNKGHLKEHVYGVHDRSAVVGCPICQKRFNTRKRMRKHFLNSHRDCDVRDLEPIGSGASYRETNVAAINYEIVEA